MKVFCFQNNITIRVSIIFNCLETLYTKSYSIFKNNVLNFAVSKGFLHPLLRNNEGCGGIVVGAIYSNPLQAV